MSLNGDRDAVEKLVDAALASLEANRARIDDLNVYPVPDGNSGVIFSQIVRGAADVLGETDALAIDADATARALRGATDAAYRAVRRPVEGTMLSVIRELAEEAEARAPARPPVGELLIDLVRRGEDALARTPEQLQVLRDAGVVDAGGAGLVELVRGVAAAVSG